jgi:hypothetical protein
MLKINTDRLANSEDNNQTKLLSCISFNNFYLFCLQLDIIMQSMSLMRWTEISVQFLCDISE